MICKTCSIDFIPFKNDKRIKFCSVNCRIEFRNKNTTNWLHNNKEHVKEYRESKSNDRNTNRILRYAIDEEYREAKKSKTKDYNNRNPLSKRIRHLKKYGINLDDYNLLLNKQNGVCAICGGNTSGAKNCKYFYVDHNHASGRVRGLLCINCNHGIGKFKDNIDILSKAIEYLRNNNG